MSIAEKLIIIAENVEKVYEAGKKNGYGGYEDGFRDGLEEGERRGIELGKEAERNAFWDAYQQNGKRTAYTFAFYSQGWTDDTFKPKYDIIASGNCSSAFAYSRITKIENVDIDFTSATVENSTNAFFNQATSLKTIRKLKFATTTPIHFAMFNGCSTLENITIEGKIGNSISFGYSPLLTADSVKSIVDSLYQYQYGDSKWGTVSLTMKSEAWSRFANTEPLPESTPSWELFVESIGWNLVLV